MSVHMLWLFVAFHYYCVVLHSGEVILCHR